MTDRTNEQLAFEEAIGSALDKIRQSPSGDTLALYWEHRLLDKETGAIKLSEANPATLEEILDDMAYVYTSDTK